MPLRMLAFWLAIIPIPLYTRVMRFRRTSGYSFFGLKGLATRNWRLGGLLIIGMGIMGMSADDWYELEYIIVRRIPAGMTFRFGATGLDP